MPACDLGRSTQVTLRGGVLEGGNGIFKETEARAKEAPQGNHKPLGCEAQGKGWAEMRLTEQQHLPRWEFKVLPKSEWSATKDTWWVGGGDESWPHGNVTPTVW